MRKLRIAILGASPCDRCVAACCRQNGHEFAVILEEDERVRFGPFAQMVSMRRSDGTLASEFVLPYRDGRCQFLGDDDRCSVYDDRPRACRAFECTTKFNAHGIDRHDPFLMRNPRVLELLQSM